MRWNCVGEFSLAFGELVIYLVKSFQTKFWFDHSVFVWSGPYPPLYVTSHHYDLSRQVIMTSNSLLDGS